MRIHRYIRKLGFAFLAIAASWAGVAQGDMTFAFNINDRAPEVPTARVKVLLQLSGAPAGSSVTVEGVTANFGAGSSTLPSGDRFRLLSGPASMPNTAIFQYETFRNLEDPSNICTLNGSPTFPQAVTVNFTGPTIQKHAMTSYGASRLMASAGIGDCTQAKRRLSNAVASFTTPPSASPIGRLPLDIVLVLDKSGSMGSKPPGDPGNPLNRYQLLANAVDRFVTTYEQTDPSIVGDRLGVVFFDSAASVVPEMFSGNQLLARNGPVDNVAGPHPWDAVIKRVKDNGPGAVTAMGTGLQKAFDYKSIAGGTSDLSVLLMTDGYQNDGPQVEKDPNTGEWKLNNVALFSQGIPIFAVGLGTPSSLNPEVLDGMASQTAGTSNLTITGDGLNQAFANGLVGSLKGNTLSLLVRDKGTYQPPASGVEVPVLIDGSISRATAVLDWQGTRNLFTLRWVDPGGNIVPASVSRIKTTFLVESVDIPADGSKNGTWKLVILPNDLSRETPFNIDVLGGDTRLKYTLQLSQPTTGAGDPMRLLAQISYDGKPLTGLDGVRVSLARPGEGLGNILADTKAGPGATSTGDVQSAYERKLHSLEDSAGLLDRVRPKPVGSAITLRDDGTGGDTTANDGIYTATLTNTGTPGSYVMDVVLDWTDSRTGAIRRLESVQRSVTVVPDPEATVVEIQEPAADGSYVVKFTPHDRLKNFKGPGYESFIRVLVSNGTVLSPVVDPSTTGTYQFRIGNILPGKVATTTIIVDGVKVRTDEPVKPGTTGGTGFSGGGGPGSAGNRAVWLAFGSTYPHGSFSNGYDRDTAFNAAFEWGLGSQWALEATIGRHQFKGKNGAPNLDADQYGVNAKRYFPMPGWRPFVTGGIGAYNFDPGSTRFGGSLGAGVQFDINPQWAIEGRYAYHWISGNSPNSQYSTLLLGLRFSF